MESDFYPRRLWGKPSEVCILRSAQPGFSETNTFHYIFEDDVKCILLMEFDLVGFLQDLTIKPKYLVTFTVGYAQKKNIDAAVKKVLLSSYSPPFLSLCVMRVHTKYASLTVFRELHNSFISL